MDAEENVRQGIRGFNGSRSVGSFVEVVRGVFLNPARFFAGLRASHEEETGVGAPLIFVGICYMIAIPLAILVAPLDPLGPAISSNTQAYYRNVGAGVALSFVLAPVFGVLCVYLGAAVQHLLVLVFVREQRGFRATFLVIAYLNALALLCWVPVLAYLVTLYAIYVATVGLREMHGTTTNRALSAVLIAYLPGFAWYSYIHF